jgi:hypothetical protein
METYKIIKGYDARYLVSDLGNVISCYAGKTKQLVKLKSKHGYLFVRLSNKNVAKTKLIHRLVAEAFIDNPNNLPQVDHINENKQDNNISNLQWIDCKNNTTKSQGVKIIQECISTGIKTEWESISLAANTLGFNKSNIQKCCAGKKPTMYKFKWYYVSENISNKQDT